MLQYPNALEIDGAEPLWRYVSLEALLATVSTKSLRMTRLDAFNDPYEGSVPLADLERQAKQLRGGDIVSEIPGRPYLRNPPDVRRRAANRNEEMSLRRIDRLKSAHASCWRRGHESEGMWLLYCQDRGTRGQGIAMRSTVAKLASSVEMQALFLSPIAYRTYHDGPPFKSELDCFFHKRRGFAHEQEVRLLRFDAQRAQQCVTYLAGFSNESPTDLAKYIYIPWSLEEALVELVISPYASEEYELDVRAGLQRDAPALVPLLQLSELSERRYPIFR